MISLFETITHQLANATPPEVIYDPNNSPYAFTIGSFRVR